MMTDPDASAAWTSRMQAITLFVDDLTEAKEFYSRAFELSVHFEDSDSAVFKFGALLSNLLSKEVAPELIEPERIAPSDIGSRIVFTIGVENVDELAAQLQERGVELLNGPMDRPWGPRTASFVDPNGYIWEIAR